jgi:hypothetical protein
LSEGNLAWMRSPRRQGRKTPEERRFTMIEDRVAAETDVVTKLSRESVAGTVAALDLPLKVLIWADEGQTKVSYYPPAALAASHHPPRIWPPAWPASTPSPTR